MSGTQVLNLAWPVFRHAQTDPARPALVVDARTYTYGELAGASARVAAWLRERVGIGDDEGRRPAAPPRVGILAARTFGSYAGILGAAWAGGAFIPLNAKQPAARLSSIIRQAGIGALVVDRRGVVRLEELGDDTPPHVLMSDEAAALAPDAPATPWKSLADLRDPPPPTAVTPDHVAYILFTSGTTGLPKGVMIGVGALRSFLDAVRSLYALGPADRVAQFIELTFDPSVMELFGCWDGGAALHVIPETKLMAPGGFLREHAITFLAAVPSLITVMQRMRQLTPGALPALRVSIFGGEGLPLDSTRAWKAVAPNTLIDNQYGPTEATVACLAQRVGDTPVLTPARGTLAIGVPFPGVEGAIVDPAGNVLGPDETGELAVAGPQLAMGYVGDDEMTARRFPTLNHPRLGPTRWYLTGDLATCDRAGQFHCLGRIDNQLKVMGHRVELEGVEAHLRAVAGTESVAAVGWPMANGNASGIVAFVSAARLAPAEVREAMRHRVPAYMLPGRVVPLDALPLSSNGKIDRHALRKMLEDGVTTTAPPTATAAATALAAAAPTPATTATTP